MKLDNEAGVKHKGAAKTARIPSRSCRWMKN
jgi:hypothetical protein